MSNFKDNRMEALSRNGNGNYCFVGSPEDITERLFKQFDATVYSIAKDVKIKVEMNPEYVGSYRLIGYNARKLTRQDFDDTEKAVDGFGSGQISAALIEFTRRNTDNGSDGSEAGSRYTKTESKNISDEFAAVTIRFKTPEDINTEQLEVIKANELSGGSNAEIAAVLAAFGLDMSDSKYKGVLTKEKLGIMLIDCLNAVNDDRETAEFDSMDQDVDNIAKSNGAYNKTYEQKTEITSDEQKQHTLYGNKKPY
jgi:Ca-activated chloride channel family protein